MTAAVPDDGDDLPIPLGGPSDLQRAWQMMAGGAPEVVQALMGIVRNSPQDSVRVQAGLGLLKMGGFGQSDVTVRIVPQQFDPAAGVGDGKESAAKRLAARMENLRKATEADYLIEVADEDTIVDAELVEES